MITEHDLNTAIAECQGKRNPDASTCIKLAAFLAIKREMYGDKPVQESAYSYASAPSRNLIEIDSGSDFANAIDGKEPSTVFPILDELMSTLKVIQPKLYNAVMIKLSD